MRSIIFAATIIVAQASEPQLPRQLETHNENVAAALKRAIAASERPPVPRPDPRRG